MSQRGLSLSVCVVWCALLMPLTASAAGSQTFSTAGSHSFTVPATYGTITVQVWGGGGGGGASFGGGNGGAGGTSSFNSTVIGYGGAGGVSSSGTNEYGAGGAGGSASGGSTNTSGAAGAHGGWGGAGGTAPNGGTGGAGGDNSVGSAGTAPGGGGGAGDNGGTSLRGGGGGSGGYASRTYTSGLTPGASISVVVGSAGAAGNDCDGPMCGYNKSGGAGAVGRVTVTWTDPLPTCSVTADVNPLAYGNSTTLRWSSTNATTMYITNVGYVTANQDGSATVGPLTTTAYNGTATGSGGSVDCNYSLTVSSPSNCTAPWGSTVSHGSSATAYQTSTVAYGSTCTAETRSCSNGTLSGSYEFQTCNQNCSFNGSAVSHGSSVTAYQSATAPEGQTCAAISQSRTCSDGSLSGSYAYASCSLACTPAYTCTGAGSQTITYTDAACATSTIDTCEAPQFCSAGSSTCLYNAVTGDITASPRIVASGKTATITWSTSNASSCTVTGNGNTWTGTAGTRTSSAITEVVRYTINCDDTDADTTEDDYSDSVLIIRIPSWIEL